MQHPTVAYILIGVGVCVSYSQGLPTAWVSVGIQASVCFRRLAWSSAL
jgi:hypothetical protein